MNKGDKCQQIVLDYKNGNKEAINQLPLYIDNMIYSLLKPYKLYPDLDDMYQVAWGAVMNCVKRYDVNKGARFTTFAYVAIERELRQYRRRIDKHKNMYTDTNECILEILPIDGYIIKKENGRKMLVSIDNILESDDNTEYIVGVHEIRRVIREVLRSYTNKTKVDIISDHLCGIKGVYIAAQYNVSSAYVSSTIKEFFKKVREELNK